MTGDHAGGPGDDAPRRRNAWRVGTPVVVLLSGALFAVSHDNSEGTDLRPGRYADYASVARTEKKEYDELRREVVELNADIERLTDLMDNQTVREIQRQIDEIDGAAGLEAVSGPGVTVTLADAPEDVADRLSEESEINPNRLVVHQQDIQAVVNAMWVGGAEAITLQGQRIVSTTGIKCRGSAVLIQGVPYPQPYVIAAIGDPTSIEEAVVDDGDVTDYRNDSANPDISIGWDLESDDRIEAPAFDGLLDLGYAEPIG